MRISDWSSDVCSSDLLGAPEAASGENGGVSGHHGILCGRGGRDAEIGMRRPYSKGGGAAISGGSSGRPAASAARIAAISSSIERTRSRQRRWVPGWISTGPRSEEHTSELQSLMRISYAVFCLKKKSHI